MVWFGLNWNSFTLAKFSVPCYIVLQVWIHYYGDRTTRYFMKKWLTVLYEISSLFIQQLIPWATLKVKEVTVFTQYTVFKSRAMPILFCSIYFSFQKILFSDKNFFVMYLQFFSIRDCYIRVIHYIMTALLEYLDLSAVFL